MPPCPGSWLGDQCIEFGHDYSEMIFPKASACAPVRAAISENFFAVGVMCWYVQILTSRRSKISAGPMHKWHFSTNPERYHSWAGSCQYRFR
jgi:hypothetical protein